LIIFLALTTNREYTCPQAVSAGILEAEQEMVSMEIQEIRLKTLPVFSRHGVVRAAVFGSSRGEAGEESDIDILVEFQDEKTLLDLVALQIELEESLGKEVDVLTYQALHPLIKEKVLQEQVALL